MFPCVNKWFQFISFGDGSVAPKGSIYSTIPSHIVKQIHNLGHEHISNMCLGVYGRGHNDEVEWDEQEDSEHKTDANNGTGDGEHIGWKPLSAFHNQHVITTQCNNKGAIIEWLFVPFIVEETPLNEDSQRRGAQYEEQSKVESLADRNDSVINLEESRATLDGLDEVDPSSSNDPIDVGASSSGEHVGITLTRSDVPSIPPSDDGAEEL